MYSILRIIELFRKRVVRSAGPVKSTLYLVLIPIIASLFITYVGFTVTDRLLTVIIPAVSILVGFSLNTVVLLLRYSENTDASNNLMENVRTFSVYSILVGMAILALTISMIISESLAFPQNLTTSLHYISSGAVFFLLLHYLSVVLLLPSRVFVIVENSE